MDSKLKIMTIGSSTTSHLSDTPLFSCIVTVYTLILLYFPHDLRVSFSPVLILTLLIILFLLRLGAIQKQNHPHLLIDEAKETNEHEEIPVRVDNSVFSKSESGQKPNLYSKGNCGREDSAIIGFKEIDENGDTQFNHHDISDSLTRVDKIEWGQYPESKCRTERLETIEFIEYCYNHLNLDDESGSLTMVDQQMACKPEPGQYPSHGNMFVEWDLGAPLEVIYEGEDGEEDMNEEKVHTDPNQKASLVSYPSLSMCYPESDSDSSSEIECSVDGEEYSPENGCFKWEDEEHRNGWLIEIDIGKTNKDPDLVCYFEEDNLIEIDLSPAKNDNVLIYQAQKQRINY